MRTAGRREPVRDHSLSCKCDQVECAACVHNEEASYQQASYQMQKLEFRPEDRTLS